jgi:hypothetical protein
MNESPDANKHSEATADVSTSKKSDWETLFALAASAAGGEKQARRTQTLRLMSSMCEDGVLEGAMFEEPFLGSDSDIVLTLEEFLEVLGRVIDTHEEKVALIIKQGFEANEKRMASMAEKKAHQLSSEQKRFFSRMTFKQLIILSLLMPVVSVPLEHLRIFLTFLVGKLMIYSGYMTWP